MLMRSVINNYFFQVKGLLQWHLVIIKVLVQ
jgi:hypothetical protein